MNEGSEPHKARNSPAFTRFFGSLDCDVAELEPAVGREIPLCGVLAREATPARSGKEDGVDMMWWLVPFGTCQCNAYVTGHSAYSVPDFDISISDIARGLLFHLFPPELLVSIAIVGP